MGRKYTDLYLEWPLDQEKGFYGDVQRVVLELKILYSNLDKIIADGLVQVAGYAEQCGAEGAHSIVFNRDDAVGWDDKVWYQGEHVVGTLAAGVWGC